MKILGQTRSEKITFDSFQLAERKLVKFWPVVFIDGMKEKLLNDLKRESN
jgi:hypothetical protein